MSFCYCGSQLPDGLSVCVFCDWVGIGENPRINEVSTSLVGVEGSIASFDHDIEGIFMENAYGNASPFYPIPDEAIWKSTTVSCDNLPFLPPAPLSDYTGSSSASSFDPPTPTADDLQSYSSSQESLSQLTLVGDEELFVDCHNIAPIIDFDFTFQLPSPSVSSSSYLSSPPITPCSPSIPTFGYGQQVSQHKVGAAATDVHGLRGRIVDGAMPEPVFPSTISAPPVAAEVPPATPDDKAIVKNVKKRKHDVEDVDVTEGEDDANDNDDDDEDDEEDAPKKPRSAKRRRRQSTAQVHSCPMCSKSEYPRHLCPLSLTLGMQSSHAPTTSPSM